MFWMNESILEKTTDYFHYDKRLILFIYLLTRVDKEVIIVP